MIPDKYCGADLVKLLKFQDGFSEVLRDAVSNHVNNLDAYGATRFVVAVSGAKMLPPVITVKTEPDTKFSIVRFSSCFYEVAMNEELALSSIDDFKVAMDFATNEQNKFNTM